MRLRELDACFVYDARHGACRRSDADSVVGVQGAHYVRVFFSNPVDAPVAPPEADGNPRWQMSGTHLDNLTLSPSINLDVPGNDGGCRWHGFVSGGAAV